MTLALVVAFDSLRGQPGSIHAFKPTAPLHGNDNAGVWVGL